MVVAAFNQEKALVGAISVITNLRMELFKALVYWDLSYSYIMVTLRENRCDCDRSRLHHPATALVICIIPAHSHSEVESVK